MNQREFDRAAGLAAQRFSDLMKTDPGLSVEAAAGKAWDQAVILAGETSRREADLVEKSEPRRLKQTTA